MNSILIRVPFRIVHLVTLTCVGVFLLFAFAASPEVKGQVQGQPAESTEPIQFAPHEKIVFLGNSLGERMGLFGHFEARLHQRFPELELKIRSFARPAETVAIQQRSNDYTRIDDPQKVFGADTYLCFFGFNESFEGESGIETFKSNYKSYLSRTAIRYRVAADNRPRFILVSPIAFEPSGEGFLPDGATENKNLKRYTDAVRDVAAELNLPFVDLFTPTFELFQAEKGLNYTINGCHLNEIGDQVVSRLLDEGLFGESTQPLAPDRFETVRQAVVDKAWVHQQDYRKLNGWYVYGGRRTWDTETFPLEYKKIRNMVEVREQEIWALAQSKKSLYEPDDSDTGELHNPPTRFGDPSQKYSEAETLTYLTPDEFIAKTEVPEGFKIELFADETQFPELANPVQLNFDNRGRLWVACMPTYPQWKPGEVKPNDKLIILEDTDQDGKADACKVFYDQLHCPTGFEFWNGGVLVIDQPRLIFLKDTDGDDKADVVVQLIDGIATDDTHHTWSAFQWNHSGQLHMLEGIATSTTIETPWGPHLSKGPGGAYVLDPRSLKLTQFSLPGQYNMWSYVFNEWGQGFPGDGTTCNQAWDTPLSGASFGGRKGIRFIFDNEGMRPGFGSEFLVSRHFPDEVQGQFTFSCVINMNGFPRFSLGDDGGGFAGKRLKKPNGEPDDLIRSHDRHFRPGAPQIGPDGAMWFLDWCNALIGHMQYSQRDPNRDKSHGRIYRLVYPSRPLVEPVTQYGKSAEELLDQLMAYEWRTRYRARRELRDRDWSEISEVLDSWLLDQLVDSDQGSRDQGKAEHFDIDKLLSGSEDDEVEVDPETESRISRAVSEVIWLQDSHRQLNLGFLSEMMQHVPAFEARAAIVHVVADARDRIPNALDLLIQASTDPHPRVRTEAARGLSFFSTAESMRAVLAMLDQPEDYWCDYTIYHALGANQSVWRPDYLSGKLVLSDRANGLVRDLLSSTELDQKALPLLLDAHKPDQTPEQRNKIHTALADLEGGNARHGREIFKRNCANCHVVENEGRDFGPNLSDVAIRLTRAKIVESILDPNADVEEKYRSTLILTIDGDVISGLLVKEDEQTVEIYDGTIIRKVAVDDIEQRTTKSQSSMPDDVVTAMSPSELVHVIEYLGTLKTKPESKSE